MDATELQQMVADRKSFIGLLDCMTKMLERHPEECWITNERAAFHFRALASEMEQHCKTLEKLISETSAAADIPPQRNPGATPMLP